MSFVYGKHVYAQLTHIPAFKRDVPLSAALTSINAGSPSDSLNKCLLVYVYYFVSIDFPSFLPVKRPNPPRFVTMTTNPTGLNQLDFFLL